MSRDFHEIVRVRSEQVKGYIAEVSAQSVSV